MDNYTTLKYLCKYQIFISTPYRFPPREVLEAVTELKLDEVELYNLRIVGNPIHIISQEEEFRCYYPENFSFTLQPNEGVCLIENDKVYVEAWVEEGWDDENDCATDEYNYYNKVIVKFIPISG